MTINQLDLIKDKEFKKIMGKYTDLHMMVNRLVLLEFGLINKVQELQSQGPLEIFKQKKLV
jgi:hypothetical protein